MRGAYAVRRGGMTEVAVGSTVEINVAKAGAPQRRPYQTRMFITYLLPLSFVAIKRPKSTE